MNESDEKFGRETKKLFDRSVEGLDASTLSRLNQSRQLALAQTQQAHTQLLRWAPATGMVAAVLIVVMVMRGPTGVDGIDLPVAATDMEILLGEESIDMLEDLEFYSWLDMVEAEDGGDVG